MRLKQLKINRITQKIALFLVLCLQAVLPAFALETGYNAHVYSRIESSHQEMAPQDTLTLAVTFEMEPEWHIYWKNSGDAGLPTEVLFKNNLLEPISPLYMPTPIRFDTFGIVNYGYKETVTFWQDFKVLKAPHSEGEMLTVTADIHYLACKDICLPGQVSLSKLLRLSNNSLINNGFKERIDTLKTTLPQLNSQNISITDVTQDSNAFYIHIKSTEPIDYAQEISFIPAKELTIQDDSLQEKRNASERSLILEIKRDKHNQELDLKGILKINGENVFVGNQNALTHAKARADRVETRGNTLTKNSTQKTEETDQKSNILTFSVALLFAFLGGLILNLMPCVLPVLSLKIMGLIHHTREAHPYKHGIAYLLGILSTFFALAALLILLRIGGEHIGWGFQLQSPTFVAALTVIMLLVSLQLFGLFEFGLFFTRLGKYDKGYTYRSTYFGGVLMTLVATPCTAPFMGPAFGFALTQPPAITLITFMTLGLGLGFPYFILTAFPALAKRLPHPGPWEKKLKHILGIPMLLTALWLLWVFLRQTSIGDTGVLVLGLTLMTIVSFFYGKLTRFRKQITLTWVSIIVLTVVAADISVKIPSDKGLFFNLTASSEKEDTVWQPWTKEAERMYLQNGYTVFVNFTADWCITCKFNERVALTEEKLKQHMKKEAIVFLKGNWTKRDSYITDELEAHKRAGVPLYLVYKPENPDTPTILPQILTPSDLTKVLTQ